MIEPDARERILAAALKLLAEGGEEAVSTRSVSAAAGVQPPTIYRLFGDKQGLLDAVATRGLLDFLATKTAQPPADDPVTDLRRGWDLNVEMGLANPAVYRLLYAGTNPPASREAMDAGVAMLADKIHRIAAAGRLRVPESLALSLIRAAGMGTTLALISTTDGVYDLALSAAAREAVIAAVTTDEPVGRRSGPEAAAITLRAALPERNEFSAAEKALLDEWLSRIG
ncbi:TetR/AcrR family transcriptional regulator [Actinoplanes sp. NPDC049265]|uniref:TetR/AcrR family transcriptional regulator n=1 Tax=Actinoplanes sp. NPDC049265 TaxID=3363902 RepID=UPI0037119E61